MWDLSPSPRRAPVTIRRRRPNVETLEGRTLLTAGALDTSFGGTGVVTTSTGDAASAVVIQPDLKTVVAGDES